MKFNVDDLIEKGLVRKKTYTDGKYKGLSVLKYTKSVFWNNLWHIDDRLLECRGIVVDEDDNVIVRPFKKVFNLGENGVGVPDNENVTLVRKVNGFLGCATKTDKYGLIISTTGTLDSKYVALAEEWISKGKLDLMIKGYTYMFEICDSSDPHIVDEEEGAYLIGIRSTSGVLCGELTNDIVAYNLGYKRPEVIRGVTIKDTHRVCHEGFMVLDERGFDPICKVKSPHYLSKKAFLRMGRKRIDLAWDNPTEFKKQIDEEFYDFHEFLLKEYTNGTYNSLTEDERRKLIEEFFSGK